jgi:hypothetical protein
MWLQMESRWARLQLMSADIESSHCIIETLIHTRCIDEDIYILACGGVLTSRYGVRSNRQVCGTDAEGAVSRYWHHPHALPIAFHQPASEAVHLVLVIVWHAAKTELT